MVINQQRQRSTTFKVLALILGALFFMSSCSGDESAVDVRAGDSSDVEDTSERFTDEEARAIILQELVRLESLTLETAPAMLATGSMDAELVLESGPLSGAPETYSMSYEVAFDGENYSSWSLISGVTTTDDGSGDVKMQERLVDGVHYSNVGKLPLFSLETTEPFPALWLKTPVGDDHKLHDPFGNILPMFTSEDVEELGSFSDEGLVERDGRTLRWVSSSLSVDDMIGEFRDEFERDPQLESLARHLADVSEVSLDFFLSDANELALVYMSFTPGLDMSGCLPLQYLADYMPKMTTEYRYEPLPTGYVIEAPDPAEVADADTYYERFVELQESGFDFSQLDEDGADGDVGGTWLEGIGTDTAGGDLESETLPDDHFEPPFSAADYDDCPTF